LALAGNAHAQLGGTVVPCPLWARQVLMLLIELIVQTPLPAGPDAGCDLSPGHGKCSKPAEPATTPPKAPTSDPACSVCSSADGRLHRSISLLPRNFPDPSRPDHLGPTHLGRPNATRDSSSSQHAMAGCPRRNVQGRGGPCTGATLRCSGPAGRGPKMALHVTPVDARCQLLRHCSPLLGPLHRGSGPTGVDFGGLQDFGGPCGLPRRPSTGSRSSQSSAYPFKPLHPPASETIRNRPMSGAVWGLVGSFVRSWTRTGEPGRVAASLGPPAPAPRCQGEGHPRWPAWDPNACRCGAPPTVPMASHVPATCTPAGSDGGGSHHGGLRHGQRCGGAQARPGPRVGHDTLRA
jgi:hypothetical protein